MAIIVNVLSHENLSEVGSITPVVVGRSDFNAQLELDLECTFFNDQGVFTESILYYHVTGESGVYMGLVNNPHTDFSIVLKNEQSDRKMMVRFQESKFIRHPVSADVVIVRGVKYKVRDVQPDGLGTVTLELQRIYQ